MTEPAEGGGPGDAATSGTDLPRCYRHPDRETGVRCTRCERPICPQCMVPASVGFQCPECVTEGRRSVRPARTAYGGTLRRGGVDATRVLIAINVVIFIITAASGAGTLTGGGTSTIYDRFALEPAAVANGEWWRLLSSMFLHYGIFHIGFNMWALYVIGTPLEQWLGRLRYVVLYLLAGFGGGILSITTGPLLSQAAGASGAIFGLFGAFYVIAQRRRMQTGGIVGLIVINLVLSFTIANIDWRGHVGGLIVGGLIGLVLAWAPLGPNRDRLQAAGCAVIAVVLAAAGYLGARHIDHTCAQPTTGADFAACAQAGFLPGG